MPRKRLKISVLIPAHNEEKMISACILSCLKQTRKPDQILVVDDGSTDGTSEILKKYKDKITLIRIPKATGNKSKAQELGIKKVTGDIFIATDGDTIIDKNFIKLVEQDFKNDKDLSVVAGYVKSTKYNFLTSLREIDYTIGQDIYKRAQSTIGFVLVVPGCAGVFKTSLFRDGTINFEHDTLTEDLDFTYKINKAGLKIKFNRRAVVYTQDPDTLSSYINQMRRWYGGGWQNLKKHFDVSVTKPSAALMLSMSYIEGFMSPLLFFVVPFLNMVFFLKLLVLYLVSNIVMGIYSSIKKGRIDLLLYSPLGVILTYINAYVFFEQFFKEMILNKKSMKWFHPERRSEVIKV